MQKKLNCRFSNPEINFQNGKRNKIPKRFFNLSSQMLSAYMQQREYMMSQGHDFGILPQRSCA